MAIYSAVPPPEQQVQPAGVVTPIDIDAWTVDALASLSVSPNARGTGVTLSIPLDDSQPRTTTVEATVPKTTTYTKRRELGRRDSLKSREALLKGKEGSRRRQRWENGMRIAHGVLVSLFK
jgi:hypothetical protein